MQVRPVHALAFAATIVLGVRFGGLVRQDDVLPQPSLEVSGGLRKAAPQETAKSGGQPAGPQAISGFRFVGHGHLPRNDVPRAPQPGNVTTLECARVCEETQGCYGFSWFLKPAWSSVPECYLKTHLSACPRADDELVPLPDTETWQVPSRCAVAADNVCANAHRHSQFNEDFLLLPFLRAITGRARGTFVEMGAYDGFVFSNTFMLQRCFNWSGERAGVQPARPPLPYPPPAGPEPCVKARTR